MFINDQIDDTFVSLYSRLRKEEGRQLNDEVVKSLPFINEQSPYYPEWQLRLLSTMKLYQYLLQKNKPLKILDYGCGNGWLANMLTEINSSVVWAADVNSHELDQASRVFGNNPSLNFTLFDIRSDDFLHKDFDIIVLAATVQYFPSLPELIHKLLKLLTANGEIHILDSPIYPVDKVQEAKKRSITYFEEKGFPSMAAFYHHHNIKELQSFNIEWMYNPYSLLNRVNRKILSEADSPFPWIKIKNN